MSRKSNQARALKEAAGRRLRRWRKEKGGKEQKAFWLRYGFNPSKMCGYETGRELPNAEKIVEICRKAGISADYWLLGKRPKERDS